jgi:hypothetical protein
MDDVVARLREGGHAVPPAQVDAAAVLAGSKRSLRRRQLRLAATGVVAAGLLALVVSPVQLPRIPAAGPPDRDGMTRDVTGLQRDVLPVLRQLRPQWYEVEQACDILEYRRGTFSDDGACGGRPGERPFDAAARSDLDRLVAAVERSGADVNELRGATYGPTGQVLTAEFLLEDRSWQWNWAYVWSPDAPPRDDEEALGPVTYTPIGTTGWYLEKAPDD